ncbi:MAG: polyphosphate polymerase domain-containing protein [Anaerolineae bacterium]
MELSYLSIAPQPPAILSGQLSAFEPITLAEMEGVALLDRSEVKYVFAQSLLPTALERLSNAYRVLVVAGKPYSHYRTLYFDTADLALYRRHHAGALDRYKVRTREYLDSHAAFLEVKHKIGERHTVKERIPIRPPATVRTPQAADFLARACPYPADALSPSVLNLYTRITLVGKGRAERVTLDLGLTFARDGQRVTLPGIVVAEVKYSGPRRGSEFMELMHRLHVREAGFSKYCLGISLLYPEVKHNRFKPKQRLIVRLLQERSGS